MHRVMGKNYKKSTQQYASPDNRLVITVEAYKHPFVKKFNEIIK